MRSGPLSQGGINMKELGILVLNLEQEAEYFNQLGVYAKKFDFHLYLFTPDSYSLVTNTILGKKFISEYNWLDDTFNLPEYIYDRCFYPSTIFKNYYAPMVQALKESNQTIFIGHGLPGKLFVYQELVKNPTLQNFLPETEKLSGLAQLHHFIERFKTVIIKPIEGSQGKGIYRIKEFEKVPSGIIKQGTHLIQPYLSLEVDNQPFDIRILLQKNQHREWIEQGRGVRVGKPEALLSNLHAGGHVVDYTSWINKHFVDKKQQINQNIEEIIKALPAVLDEKFPPLFEIGLDIGLDQNGHVWILEVNSKPGHQVLEFFNNHKMYEAPFLYCTYLSNIKEGKNNGKNLSNKENPCRL